MRIAGPKDDFHLGSQQLLISLCASSLLGAFPTMSCFELRMLSEEGLVINKEANYLIEEEAQGYRLRMCQDVVLIYDCDAT